MSHGGIDRSSCGGHSLPRCAGVPAECTSSKGDAIAYIFPFETLPPLSPKATIYLCPQFFAQVPFPVPRWFFANYVHTITHEFMHITLRQIDIATGPKAVDLANVNSLETIANPDNYAFYVDLQAVQFLGEKVFDLILGNSHL